MLTRQFFLLVLLLLTGCQNKDEKPQAAGNYGYDLDFLRKYDPSTIELTNKTGESRVILSAKYQGRVMTSTSAGETGNSYGWINYDLIASGRYKSQFNPVGGEERFWLGPEGGQFALYFAPGDSFKISKWQVPPVIDTVSFDVAEQTDTSAVFEKTATVRNYSGTIFDLKITRRIELYNQDDIEALLEFPLPEGLRSVAYRTINTITNTGEVQWQKETGLISIWLLGMFTPTPSTIVVVPFAEHGQYRVTSDYFGEIPGDRLEISERMVLFRCDGKFRSKIGIPPDGAWEYAASYDATKKILTVIQFDVDTSGDYVNSKWEIQEMPYNGDVFNSYNDGPLADGTQLGPFYELESSSAAKALQPGETQHHSQTTIHLEGDEESLGNVTIALFG